MTFLLSMIIVSVYIIIFRKQLNRQRIVHYIGAIFLTIWFVLTQLQTSFQGYPEWFKTYVQPLFVNCGISTAMFVVVMYTGALKKGSPLMKKLMPIRAELSVIASTLAIGHNIINAKLYFNFMIYKPEMFAKFPLTIKLATYSALGIIAIMIPLWITSYYTVRKRMTGKSWIKLQRWAYLFYGLVYAQVMLLMIPKIHTDNSRYLITTVIYTLVFGIYAVMRLHKAYREGKIHRTFVGVGLTALLIIFLCVSNYSVAAFNNSQQESTLEASSTSKNQSDKAGSEENNHWNAEVSKEGIGQPAYKDGTYSNKGTGYNGPIYLDVVIQNGVIHEIIITEHIEDDLYMDMAVAILDDILEKQTYKVDAISEATVSCVGIKSAVKKALKEAGQ